MNKKISTLLKRSFPMHGNKNIVLILLSLLVFREIFSFKYLVSLDSVYFFNEAYVDLIKYINVWSSYNSPFGGVLMVQWLYPVTFIAGFIGKLFNLDWNILVRLFFYMPSIFLSIYSIQKLGSYFKFSDKGVFLMSIIYVFNTYFILLVDGGQLGVMLAYAILPLAIESILNTSFYRTTLILSLTGIFDPRFLIIAVITGFLINKFNFKKIFKLLPVMLVVLLINSYWIIPLLKVGTINVTTFVSELRLTSFLNPLFLYQPHWPYNEFGKVTYPSILFLIFPVLLVISSLFKPTKEKSYWMLLFIIFAFLVKGQSNPLGDIYSYIINTFSFASVFRDSTKFFAPLIIIYAMIVSRYYSEIKNKSLQLIIPILIFVPLVPGLISGVNNNLSGTKNVNDLLRLKESIKSDNFSRTVYIPQKPQLAYQTENNQAVDGRVLTDYLPFAADNYGSEDRFNFMLRDNYLNYFRSLGVKNIVYLSSKKPEVANIDNPMPENYYIDKMAVVVGSPIGAQKLVPEYGVIFVEDGKTDLGRLLQVPSEKLFYVLNKKSLDDLIIAGLKNEFIDPSLLTESSWGKYLKDDYLTWKYQLLIREIDTKEINYNSGIILSTVENEKVDISYDFKKDIKYKIFIRTIAGKDSKGISVDNKQFKIPSGNTFNWIDQAIVFGQDTNNITLKNNGGFNVIGNILIIEENKYQSYYKDVKGKLNNYKIYNLNSKLPVSKISFYPKSGWLILNQSYNNLWRLRDSQPFPVNSITTGFVVDDGNLNKEPYFKGQKILDQSVKISLASVLGLVVSYLGYAVYTKSR